MQDYYEHTACSSFGIAKGNAKALVPKAVLKNFLLLLVFGIISSGVYAQEICNNGLDDDNDGYVDCFDPDCSGSFFCGNQFFGGAVPSCQTAPPPSPGMTLSLLWATDSVATPLVPKRTPIIGDIDLDGVPEVITGAPVIGSGTYVFNGANGLLERTITSPPTNPNMNAYAIADIDNDGFGEIIMVSTAAAGRQLFCYEHTGSLKWTSSAPVGYFPAHDSWTPHVADFEEDGLPEIYVGNQIFDGANGNLIVGPGPGTSMGENGGSGGEPFSAAADVLPSGFCPDCGGLELVSGNSVYSVNLGAGTMTMRTSITGFPDGLTSLGDIDRDGDIDAVVVGQNLTGRGIMYAWDLQSSTQIGTTMQIDATSIAGGAITNSGGIAAIDDINSDGVMEVVVAGRNVVVAYQFVAASNSFVELWAWSSVCLSGRSGVTLFDFDGDDIDEVVFKDENALTILSGANGGLRASAPCPSAITRMETPVIADVDNNGQANIICGCGGNVRAFQTGGTPWTTTRNVWNQRNYFVLNIKDNLRVPRVQQRQELGYPAGTPVNYPFNSFMKQTNKLADNGALVYPAANDNVLILNPSTDINLGPCQDGVNDSIGVRLSVNNTGNVPIPAGTMISFYNGNPYFPGSSFIRNFAMPNAVPAGGSATMPVVSIDDQGGTFVLFFQVNDNGSGTIPIPGPAFGHLECNFNNNLGSYNIVNCGNLPPVIDTFGISTTTILFSSPEDQVASYCFSATDPQGDAHDVTALIGTPSIGTVAGLANGDSCITLTPNTDVAGTTTFSVIVCDNGNPTLCDTTVFIWTVTPVNDRPIAVDDATTTNEDTPVTINVLPNDSDIELDPLTAILIGQPANGTATIAGGVVTYTPNLNYFGTETFAYQLCDNALPPGCDTALITIIVNSVNDAPTAMNDSLTMPNDTVLVNVAVQSNDTDIEPGAMVTAINCGPSHGSATVSGTAILYIPDSTYIGLDTICYTLCDGGSPVICDTGYVYLTIFNSNVAPIALDDSDSTTYQDTVIVSILGNDSDPNGQAIDLTSITCGPNHGTISIDTLLGIITYIPDTLFLGIDTLCYVICDNPPAGLPFCTTANIYITVIPDNRPPVAVRDTLTLAFNTPGTRNLLTNDSDPDGDLLTVTLLSQPANGTVLVANGIATYTPNATFVGVDSFCYQLCDDGLPPLCDTACAVFTIIAPNELVIPNGFSPNGDGINDVLEIGAIQLFPNNNLQVFTRWGTSVFEADGYNNEWDGTFNANPVPDGTYFYRFDPGDGTSVLTGFILVYR